VPTNSRKPLHKRETPLPGVVLPQWVKCGRPHCRCARGELHGPYFCRFWREGGKLRKAYVRLEDLEQVKARCEARRQARRDVKAGWEQWRDLLANIRQLEQR
jgi:hypothetical protein